MPYRTGNDAGAIMTEAALKTPGRPRSEGARQAVLAAAYDILAERDLASFSIDAVATRAGVARTTIYRWWPSKGLLAMESFLEAMKPQLRYQRTACAADDFRAMLQSIGAVMAGPGGRIIASIMAEAQSDPGTLRAFLDGYVSPLRQESLALLRAGQDRGQLRPDASLDHLLDAAVGALYFRMLLGRPPDPAWVATLAATLLDGVRAR